MKNAWSIPIVQVAGKVWLTVDKIDWPVLYIESFVRVGLHLV